MTAIPTLQTERLTLRAPGPQDLPAFAAFYAGERAVYVGGPRTEWETWRYLAEVIGHWALRGFGRWIAETRADGTPVGLVGLHYPMEWPEREIGWMIFEGAEGKGYGFEAAMAARAYAYGTLGWSTAISLIDPENARSVALAERMGARRDGDHDHPGYGAMGIWRHPSPEPLSGAARASMEICA